MDALPHPPATAEPCAAAQWAWALIQHRQTILPKRLAEPGPDQAQLDLIWRAAAAAPDHGELVPWRFVLVPATQRERLAQVFADALLARDPLAAPEQVARAREKAFRAPVLMLAVVRTGVAGEDVPAAERLISAGCAIQNMLLMATALGYGSALTSGKALDSPGLRALFALAEHEQAVCFVSLGTAVRRKPSRERPPPAHYVSSLPPQP
ncbi:nitroreductase [Ramlibacter sp.]|uniref:nitroreductase family protein n=1 Tax=Ramlibacter sp. TaxID=1917967 RepID=UPI002B7D3292|nr:nitroreductase [Ramlibacter sp.]HWI80869.1 nitroreductase [Ramlibacter sp.]